MICLGCGADCQCADPAKFATWPLEAAVSRDGLQQIADALAEFEAAHGAEDSELGNIENAIRNFLARPAEPTDEDLLA